jgi:hypothetical protein
MRALVVLALLAPLLSSGCTTALWKESCDRDERRTDWKRRPLEAVLESRFVLEEGRLTARVRARLANGEIWDYAPGPRTTQVALAEVEQRTDGGWLEPVARVVEGAPELGAGLPCDVQVEAHEYQDGPQTLSLVVTFPRAGKRGKDALVEVTLPPPPVEWNYNTIIYGVGLPFTLAFDLATLPFSLAGLWLLDAWSKPMS